MIARGLLDTRHPILAHLIVTRRCNLSCAYCNEYDRVSGPVPLAVLIERVDRLAALGTQIITLSGGEPLLHPELEQVVARVRRHGLLAGLITNAYLLTESRIRALNRAGLDHMQVSIDNLQPDAVSKKSLRVLEPKLRMLARYAEFHVNVNAVLGSGVPRPEDALEVARRAVELGFSFTVGILHGPDGRLVPLGPREREVYERLSDMGRVSYSRFHHFRRNLVEGRENQWRCRAGARYLYICEDGLVHYCSQRRGRPGKPLTEYSVEDLRREFYLEKPCAPRCTLACVHQVSLIDAWRAPQRGEEGFGRPDLVTLPSLGPGGQA
ncbi:MAG: radical SAM protein [Bryobacterales bacterium]|nr:radical SAM protein [Bryobacteraceae bacterium]MDW8130362.1 radical SAM protein [Bryobacterales bacterium]